MQLLQDVFIIEQLQVLSEGKQEDVMKIRGVFGRCNEKNNNGRIYPTGVVASQLEKVQPLIAERRLCGELDHPQNDTVKLSNASHLITKLDMRGNELIGEAEILKTPAGLTAKALVDGGVKIGISSRGMGTLSEDQNGDKIVNEDYRLVTFDLVADPSTRGAYPGLAESTESKFVRESQSKLKKEGNFVTLLNSKLRDTYQPWIDEAMAGKGDTAAKRKADRERANRDRMARRAKATPMEDALELIKADGHWHRIAEAILNGLGKPVEEAMDSFDKATLDAEDESRRTGKAIKLPKWEDHGPTAEQVRKGKVIDTSTPEGKAEADALEAKIKKKKQTSKKKASKKKSTRRATPRTPDAKGQKKLPGMENAWTVYNQMGKLFLEIAQVPFNEEGGRFAALTASTNQQKATKAMKSALFRVRRHDRRQPYVAQLLTKRKTKAESIAASTLYKQTGKLFLEGRLEDLEKSSADATSADATLAATKGTASSKSGGGLVSKVVGDRAARVQARKMPVAQARGAARAERITAKSGVAAQRVKDKGKLRRDKLLAANKRKLAHFKGRQKSRTDFEAGEQRRTGHMGTGGEIKHSFRRAGETLRKEGPGTKWSRWSKGKTVQQMDADAAAAAGKGGGNGGGGNGGGGNGGGGNGGGGRQVRKPQPPNRNKSLIARPKKQTVNVQSTTVTPKPGLGSGKSSSDTSTRQLGPGKSSSGNKDWRFHGKGKTKRWRGGFGPDEHISYKQIGMYLAEMLNLVERGALYTMSPEQKKIENQRTRTAQVQSGKRL